MRICLPSLVLSLVCLFGRCLNLSQLQETTEPIASDVGEGWLSFALQSPERHGKTTRYRAKYVAEGKTARFDFELSARDPSGDPPVAFGSGKFISIPGSDASVLLRNLKSTLQAKTMPSTVERVTELPFVAAVLGTDQSHGPQGGFFERPAGHWTAMKIFIGKQDDPAEVFLNFNPVLGKGEFSIKDEDYGDVVLRELAKVL